MISHRIIADLIHEIGHDHSRKSTERIWDFLSKYKLESFVEKSIRLLEAKQKETSNFETLIVRSGKAQVGAEVLSNIKKTLGVEPEVVVRLDIDPEIKAGFVAFYRGKMFDARLESLARKMSKALKENFEN